MCTIKGCEHAPVCYINGLPYCGTDAWDLRYVGAVAL